MANYLAARKHIEDASILLWRGSADPMARLIRRVTKSPYSHAAFAFELSGRLMCYESVPGGVGLMPLSERVKMLARKQSIDVFRMPNINIPKVRHEALRFAGRGYDYPGIIRFAQAALFGGTPKTDDSLLFCSEMIGYSLGMDRASFIAPGDLAQIGELYLSLENTP